MKMNRKKGSEWPIKAPVQQHPSQQTTASKSISFFVVMKWIGFSAATLLFIFVVLNYWAEESEIYTKQLKRHEACFKHETNDLFGDECSKAAIHVQKIPFNNAIIRLVSDIIIAVSTSIFGSIQTWIIVVVITVILSLFAFYFIFGKSGKVSKMPQIIQLSTPRAQPQAYDFRSYPQELERQRKYSMVPHYPRFEEEGEDDSVV